MLASNKLTYLYFKTQEKKIRQGKQNLPRVTPTHLLPPRAERSYLPRQKQAGRTGLGEPGGTQVPTSDLGALGAVWTPRKRARSHRPLRWGKLRGPALGITSRQGRQGRLGGGAWPFKGPSQLVLGVSPLGGFCTAEGTAALSALGKLLPQSQLAALE